MHAVWIRAERVMQCTCVSNEVLIHFCSLEEVHVESHFHVLHSIMLLEYIFFTLIRFPDNWLFPQYIFFFFRKAHHAKMFALNFLCLETPLIGIDEHTAPGTDADVLPVLRLVRPLPHLCASLRMRHHCQVTAVRTAQASDSEIASVRVQGIPAAKGVRQTEYTQS